MDIDNRTIWQQAAGDTELDYADLCVRWGVILNGPGYAGPWPESRDQLAEDGVTPRKLTDLRRFCDEVGDGDLIVLRLGTSRVLAVGEVVGGYEWCVDFGDVDGWEINHVRRVRWLWESLDDPQVFPIYTLNQGDTTQRLNAPAVTDWLVELDIPDERLAAELPALPDEGSSRELEFSDVSSFLFDHGVASDSIANLVRDIGELVRIAQWYKRTSKPSEHETVSYLVIPLLRALGWTPQRMAVEWNHVDLALFYRLPRGGENLAVVVEAKKMDASCLSAMGQAQTYAQGNENCHRLIVTDGLRYGAYTRNDAGQFVLAAYMNLTRLRSNYPIYPCAGAREALLMMAPEWTP